MKAKTFILANAAMKGSSMRFYIPLFIAIAFFPSCKNLDPNTKVIRKEFKSFVQSNFDDPKNIKEIVEISPKDTLSREKIKLLANITIEYADLYLRAKEIKDSVYNVALERINPAKRRFRGDDYDRIQGLKIITDLTSKRMDLIDKDYQIRLQKRWLQQELDTLIYAPAIYCYEIRYRIQTSEGIKLRSAFAYIDSLKGFQVVSENQNDSDMICAEYQNIFKKSREYSRLVDEASALLQEVEENLSEYEQWFRIKTY